MERRPFAENLVQRLGVHARDLAHVEMTEATLQLIRPAKRLLHLHLLIEHHADEERERISLEELVGRGVLRPDDRHDLKL